MGPIKRVRVVLGESAFDTHVELLDEDGNRMAHELVIRNLNIHVNAEEGHVGLTMTLHCPIEVVQSERRTPDFVAFQPPVTPPPASDRDLPVVTT